MKYRNSTFNGLLSRSLPVRVYFSIYNAERIGAICDKSGASFSTVVNSLVQHAMRYEAEIIKDAKDYQSKQPQHYIKEGY